LRKLITTSKITNAAIIFITVIFNIDISVKENIKPIGYGLNEIVKMNPVWFDFIDDYKNYGEGRQNGNIAQEMQKIIPEAVFTTPSTGKMGINYDQLHAVYIKAIQEQQAQIEELKLLIK
jgi:hypothetical protein